MHYIYFLLSDINVLMIEKLDKDQEMVSVLLLVLKMLLFQLLSIKIHGKWIKNGILLENKYRFYISFSCKKYISNDGKELNKYGIIKKLDL